MAKRKGILLNETADLRYKKPLLFAKLHNYKREDYTGNAKSWMGSRTEEKGFLVKNELNVNAARFFISSRTHPFFAPFAAAWWKAKTWWNFYSIFITL